MGESQREALVEIMLVHDAAEYIGTLAVVSWIVLTGCDKMTYINRIRTTYLWRSGFR